MDALTHTVSDQARLVAALHEALGDNLHGVVLFGSRARGDARKFSDWDVLLIATSLPSGVFARDDVLRAATPPDLRGLVSYIVRQPGEWSGDVPSLYFDIALDGKVLYDPSGALTQRLSRLRAWAARVGLQRSSGPERLSWKWTGAAPGPWPVRWEDT